VQKKLLLPLFLLALAAVPRAQDSLTGLWNAGGAAMLAPMDTSQSLQLVKSLVRVNLYNGFAVTSQDYLVKHAGNDSIQAHFRLPQAGSFPSPRLGKVTYLAPDLQVIKADGVVITPQHDSLLQKGQPAENWDLFSLPFAPGQSRMVTVRTITRTYLAKLREASGSKDGNAFSFHFHDARDLWKVRTGTGQLLVKLNDLSMNNVRGILPASAVTGDMRHLQFGYALDIPKDSDNLVIWYEGAPPDFPFTKKVLPSSDTLNQLMDQFPLAEFGRPDFIALNRDNYETNSDGPLASVLYYIFFLAPWVFLFGFLVFLIRKPKKKKTTDPLPPTTKNDAI
jgi:hypothetical protein